MSKEINKEPAAYLFVNGNVIAFNEEGEQIPEIQKKGIIGLVNFRNKYPNADIFFAKWNRGIIPIERLHDSFINKLEELPYEDN